MKVSKKGLIEIAAHEGIVTSPYKDSVGVWTFGIGHTAGAGKPNPADMQKGAVRPISEIMALFAKDIAKFEKRVNSAFKIKLKQHEFDGAVSFDYNTGAINTATWVKLFNAGDRSAARKSIMQWKKPAEIIPRRQKERDLIFTGKYYNNGYANAYPADSAGRVQWGKGKRVNVAELLGATTTTITDPIPADAMADGILERGERGPAVGQLILDLIKLGFYDKSKSKKGDQEFGPRTEAGVRSLQSSYGLTVDGKAGPNTFAAVSRALKGWSPTPSPKPPEDTPSAPAVNSGGLLGALIRIIGAIFGGKSK